MERGYAIHMADTVREVIGMCLNDLTWQEFMSIHMAFTVWEVFGMCLKDLTWLEPLCQPTWQFPVKEVFGMCLNK